MIPRRSFITVLIALLGLTLAPGYGDALPIIGHRLGEGSLPSPAFTITFDESVFPQGTTITDQFASFAGFGVTFSPHMIYSSQGATSCCDGIGDGASADSGYVGNTGSTTVGLANPFSIKFAGPQTAATFGLATDITETLFEARLNNLLVESFTNATADETKNAPVFFGFSGIEFDEIRVTVGLTPQSLRALIDNVQGNQLGQTPGPGEEPPLSATPEPTTLLLFGTTAGGLGLVRWRRRKHQR